MKKIFVVMAALFATSVVFAQSADVEAMKAFYTKWSKSVSNPATSEPNVKAMQDFYNNWATGGYNTSLDEYLRTQREKAQADQAKYKATVTLGQVIDLAALKGKPTVFTVAPVKGKKIEISKEKLSFPIQYSKWSYNFEFVKNPIGNLEVRVQPVEQDEALYPSVKMTLRPGINGNGKPVIFVDINAVTIDDVNDGMGWGGSYEAALLK